MLVCGSGLACSGCLVWMICPSTVLKTLSKVENHLLRNSMNYCTLWESHIPVQFVGILIKSISFSVCKGVRVRVCLSGQKYG
jgi:hypothetical protein